MFLYSLFVKGGVAGFKDMVDGAFITGANASAFTAGGKVTRSEDDGYISSSGNNNVNGFRYINTGYIVTPHTRVEFDYAFADNYPSGNYNGNHDWFMFEASGSTRFAVYHNKDGIGWCGMGTNWRKYKGVVPAKQTSAKDVRRTLIVDNHTGRTSFPSCRTTLLIRPLSNACRMTRSFFPQCPSRGTVMQNCGVTSQLGY